MLKRPLSSIWRKTWIPVRILFKSNFFTLKTWKASNWMLRLLSRKRFIISLRFSGLLMYFVIIVKLCLSNSNSPSSYRNENRGEKRTEWNFPRDDYEAQNIISTSRGKGCTENSILLLLLSLARSRSCGVIADCTLCGIEKSRITFLCTALKRHTSSPSIYRACCTTGWLAAEGIWGAHLPRGLGIIYKEASAS